ncbi:hypothetical protein [Spiroplasma taiwanense]|uniref:Transmembrane protein n=1 Tax=Spiroplasma taiwanense CT-1 TaxID=1276220 RepID=S5MBG1_9MOLU|nr:hypothetical protein [Spiroplasma taiwanense]AGR41108.1 hypothetical protein STAIW_v1c04650 [Spiroplasma taiwanense CT-1]
MKKAIYQIVFISIMAFLYYFYSAWINELEKDKDNNTLYQIFSPFKLIILGMIFTIIYASIKNLMFSHFINLKKYRASLRDNILFEFDNTLNYLSALKVFIENNDNKNIKLKLKEFSSIKYAPVYLNDFMEQLSNSLLKEEKINYLVQPCEIIIKNIEYNFESEKSKKISNKNESFYEIKMVNNYYSLSSWQSINYFLSLENERENNNNKWKITGLYISRFSTSLYLSTLFTTILFVIIGLTLNFNNISLNNLFYGVYIFGMYIFSMLFYILLLFNFSRKHKIKVYWLQILTYFIFIFLIFLNIFLNIILFPHVNAGQHWYESTLIRFLLAGLYIILSTMLLAFVLSGILELFETKKVNVWNIINTFILPLIIYILSFTMYLFSIKEGNSNEIYLTNFTIIFIYWTFSAIFNKLLSK